MSQPLSFFLKSQKLSTKDISAEKNTPPHEPKWRVTTDMDTSTIQVEVFDPALSVKEAQDLADAINYEIYSLRSSGAE